ncbi:MAG: hypothetical protein M1339_04505 [Bacteroidetes bacterium]|nr:hypothetical protein [Bacteroidota bacterium]
MSLFYVAVGKGTSLLSELEIGDSVMLNGPLGRGFPEATSGETVWIIVGGSGMAIIPIVTKSLNRSDTKYKVFAGARNARQLVHFDLVSSVDATDDGSTGYHGTVVDLVKSLAPKEIPNKIFACGPTPMLANVQKDFGSMVPTYLSVEAPMACGMGFCQGCPVKKKGSSECYLACKDGPVFRSDEIDFGRSSHSK